MSWPSVKLSDVCEINIGGTPSRSNKEYWGEGYSWVSIKDMNQGKFIKKTKEQVTELGFNKSNCKLIPTDTVILSFKLSLGKVCITQYPLLTNEAIAAFPIKNSDIICQQFLYYALKTLDYDIYTDKAVMGKTLNKKKLNLLKIPLPPLEEQKRIAAILDKADALKRKKQKALNLCDQFLKALFIDMFGDPVTNPQGWDKVVFDDLLDNIDGGWSPKCNTRSATLDEWGILKLGAITSCVFCQEENKAMLPGFEPKINLEVKAGDLLFSRKNTYELVAACAYIFDSRPKLIMSDLMFRFQLKNNGRVHPIFLWKLLIEDRQRKEIQSLAGGASGSMPNISKKNLKNIKLPIPPIELQNKFAEIVKKTEVKKAKLQQSLEKLNDTFNALSQKAFKGEL